MEPAPLTIYLYKSIADAAQAQPGYRWITGDARAGMAFPEQGVLHVVQEAGEGYTLQDTVRHEIAHMMLGWARSGPVPKWVHEGFAVWTERDSISEHKRIFEMARREEYDFEPLWRLEQFPADDVEEALAYIQSWSVVSFLIERYGPEKFSTFVRRLDQGADAALKGTYGLGLDDLDAQWRKAHHLPGIRYARALPTPVPIMEASGQVAGAAPPDGAQDASPSALWALAFTAGSILAGGGVFCLVVWTQRRRAPGAQRIAPLN
ncbi:MAG: hypothetical protein EXR52_06330 [Dehalococcoidia bacterium]|nr:hypothetical protein [Dehalococcoidia bacterium]